MEIAQILPRTCCTAKVPPIKTQGIKTKLVPFILSSIKWNGEGRWIEPFLGSGSVLFNVSPEEAIVSDTNKHIVRFYQSIQSGETAPSNLREFLETEGRLLSQKGKDHYYYVRDRFNCNGSSWDFLFLNRACFNGLMRFNSKGGYNVPFCRKNDRFSPAYITKICNQVNWVAKVMQGKNWEFIVQDWRETIDLAIAGDFAYLDPPYVGRHTDYFNQWSAKEADELSQSVRNLPCSFAYSMWQENKYRVNEHLKQTLGDYPVATYEHFYHLGASEELRHPMLEALVVSRDNDAIMHSTAKATQNTQLTFAL